MATVQAEEPPLSSAIARFLFLRELGTIGTSRFASILLRQFVFVKPTTAISENYTGRKENGSAPLATCQRRGAAQRHSSAATRSAELLL